MKLKSSRQAAGWCGVHQNQLIDLGGGSVCLDFSPSKDYADQLSNINQRSPSFSPPHSALSSCGSSVSRANIFTATTRENPVRAEFERDRWICLGLPDLVTEADKSKFTLCFSQICRYVHRYQIKKNVEYPVHWRTLRLGQSGRSIKAYRVLLPPIMLAA